MCIGKIKQWWKRAQWNSLARFSRKVRKNPEKYNINKLLSNNNALVLGNKPLKPGELERLKEMLEEYEKRIKEE